MDLVLVIGTSEERQQLWEAFASDRDPWYLRRDVERVDVERIEDANAEALARARHILCAEGASAPAVQLPDDPWQAHQLALQTWPDPAVRLRELRLAHLRAGLPRTLLPRQLDTPARVLGYFLRVKG
jgi:hypothetical protein